MNTLEDWLAYLSGQHPQTIALGLDRLRQVAQRLPLASSALRVVVAGTNGKGSVCAMLASIYEAAGYRVGVYTSPHLLRFNERIRIDGQQVSDDDLCAAFAAIEAVRGDVPLTYFEFSTLAAWWLFAQAPLDVQILEVGLGGRLDAVNLVDADCAVLTSVGLDHQDYLGPDRASIALEKVPVARAGKPFVCAEMDVPPAAAEWLAASGALLCQVGRDYGYERQEGQWRYWSRASSRAALPFPALRGMTQIHNAATVLAVVEQLAPQLPVSTGQIRRGLFEVDWPARFQVLPGRPAVVLDVAHNAHGTSTTLQNLKAMGFYETTHAVFSMLSDKDIVCAVQPLADVVDVWWLAPLQAERAASMQQLQDALDAAQVRGRLQCCPSVAEAYREATRAAGENDRILVFGSFYTVADVMRYRQSSSQSDSA